MTSLPVLDPPRNKSRDIKTVMGFDYGYKRIGVAIGQTLTATATPLITLSLKNQQPDWNRIATLILKWQPHILVVGITYQADGSMNAVSKAAQQFGHQLTRRYSIPVQTIDERLSSLAAKERIGHTRHSLHYRSHNHFPTFNNAKQVNEPLDAVAAQIILETWFTECL